MECILHNLVANPKQLMNLGKIETQKFEQKKNVEDILKSECNSIFEKSFFKKITKKIYRDKRVYNTIPGSDKDLSSILDSASLKIRDKFGVKEDNKINLMKLGMTAKRRERVLIISLEDSLDLILNILSGCEPKKIREKLGDSYLKISRGFLTCDQELLEDFSLNSLIGIDQKLDDYLYQVFKNSVTEVEFLENFMFSILRTAQSKVISLGYYLKGYMTYTLSFRSYGYASFVAYVEADIDEYIQIYEDYFLRLKTYGANEYLDSIDVPFISLN